LPDKKYYLFGQGGGKRLADQFDVPFLGELPINISVREGGDMGKPAFAFGDDISKAAVLNIAKQAARQISIRNLNLSPTKVVETMV
jgi:hypothetical protein